MWQMTQQRYRDLAEWPLMGTALVFLAAYAWQVVGRAEGSGAGWLEALMWLTWGIFAVDYAANQGVEGGWTAVPHGGVVYGQDQVRQEPVS